MNMHRHSFGLISVGLALGMGAAMLQGCDGVPDVAEECGLDVNCTAGGFAEGKASISGLPSIDAFFGAAIDLDAAMVRLSGKLRAELDAIGASVGLAPGAGGADLQLAVETYISGYAEGGLKISYQPAQCEASVEAGVAAAAECDVDVDPGEVSASCEGSCELDVAAGATCSGDATLVCTGTAPDLACSGTCSGSCVAEVTVGATCEGTCRGTCTFEGGTEVEGFEGRCEGSCDGECAVDLSAGGSCEGRCEGSCEYTPPMGECEADASARCEAMAGASIECDAGCEGTVEPPQVSAECEATVEAKASASVQCSPPTLAFEFEWAGGVDVDPEAQAEFRAWLEGFRAHFGAIVAARAEADLVVEAAAGLVTSADGALRTALDDLSAEGSLKAAFGAKCALEEAPVARDALAASSGSLSANASAAVELIGAF